MQPADPPVATAHHCRMPYARKTPGRAARSQRAKPGRQQIGGKEGVGRCGQGAPDDFRPGFATLGRGNSPRRAGAAAAEGTGDDRTVESRRRVAVGCGGRDRVASIRSGAGAGDPHGWPVDRCDGGWRQGPERHKASLAHARMSRRRARVAPLEPRAARATPRRLPRGARRVEGVSAQGLRSHLRRSARPAARRARAVRDDRRGRRCGGSRRGQRRWRAECLAAPDAPAAMQRRRGHRSHGRAANRSTGGWQGERLMVKP